MNCYILIGGRSTRMGASKTALFLPRIVAAAQPVFDELIAVQRAGGDVATIRTIFEEPHDGAAPVFGVERALRDAGARAFLLAVDYPLITNEVLRHVRDRGGVPMWQGLPQPLCAVWDPAVLPRIEERIARGVLDLQGLLCLHPATEQEIIPEAELRARFGGEPLMNVNTPEELERAERLHG